MLTSPATTASTMPATAPTGRRSAAFALTVALMASLAAQAQPAGRPSLATEKASYLAGESITLIGTNWAPGESVTLVIGTEPPGELTPLEATADESGSFTLTTTVPAAPAASSAPDGAVRSSAPPAEPMSEARESEAASASYTDEAPEYLERRMLGLRGFAADGMLKGGLLAMPGEADAKIRELLDRPEIDTIHAHNAALGCFLARIERN